MESMQHIRITHSTSSPCGTMRALKKGREKRQTRKKPELLHGHLTIVHLRNSFLLTVTGVLFSYRVWYEKCRENTREKQKTKFNCIYEERYAVVLCFRGDIYKTILQFIPLFQKCFRETFGPAGSSAVVCPN